MLPLSSSTNFTYLQPADTWGETIRELIEIYNFYPSYLSPKRIPPRRLRIRHPYSPNKLLKRFFDPTLPAKTSSNIKVTVTTQVLFEI